MIGTLASTELEKLDDAVAAAISKQSHKSVLTRKRMETMAARAPRVKSVSSASPEVSPLPPFALAATQLSRR